MEDQSSEWRQLMIQSQAGDSAAYTRLLSAIRSKFLPLCRSRVGHLGSHEDCMQEVLLAVHHALHTYQPDKPFAPWINSIVRYKMIDHLRARTRLAQRELADSEMIDQARAPERDAEDPLPEALASAIDSLDPKYRDVLMLIKVDGLSVKEAAAKLGLGVSAVKVRASRAYEMLRKKLAHVEELRER